MSIGPLALEISALYKRQEYIIHTRTLITIYGNILSTQNVKFTEFNLRNLFI